MFPLVHAEETLIAIFKFVLRTKKIYISEVSQNIFFHNESYMSCKWGSILKNQVLTSMFKVIC